MPPSAAAHQIVPVTLISRNDPECWGATSISTPSIARPSLAPGQVGETLPDGGISHSVPSPLGGVVDAKGGQWYPDNVPNNLVQCSSVPINFSRAVQNKKNIDIGRLRDYMAVVGTGAPKSFCGNVRTLAGACQNKPGEHDPILIPQTCGRRICDECWSTWALRASTRVADCLSGYLIAKYGDVQKYTLDEMERMLPRHVSFHPPDYVLEDLIFQVRLECEHEWQFPSKFLTAFRKLCEEVILGVGADGGVLVIHEIRLMNDLRDDKELKTNRYRSVLQYKDWIHKIRYYPHAHVAMFGPLENARSFYERTGWTYRNHSTDGPVRNPQVLIYYLLSHGTATNGRHSYSYFGEMSPRRLVKIGERVFRVPEECEQCKQDGLLSGYNRVISYLNKETLTFENDGNRERLMRFGKGKPVLWGFETITDRIYMKSERIGEYRLLAPGQRWTKPRWIHTGLDKEALDYLRMGGKDDQEQGWWVVGGKSVDRYDVDLKYLEADGAVMMNWFMYQGSS